MSRPNGNRDRLRAQGSANHPIVLPGGAPRRQTVARTRDHFTVDRDEEHHVAEAGASILQEYEVIDITDDNVPQQAQRQNPGQGHYQNRQDARNASLELSHQPQSVYKFRDVELKVNTCVELLEPVGTWQIQFVEIMSIYVPRANGPIIICGLPYTRNRNLRGMLELKRNEICQILEVDADDQRSDQTQALLKINLEQILKVRTLHKTNAIFPDFSVGNDRQWARKPPLEQEEQAQLMCRWKFRIEHRDARSRRIGKPIYSGVLVRMTETEASRRFARSDQELRVNWRGRTKRGGSYQAEVIQLDGPGVPGGSAGNKRQYTFADVFCGAGGTTRGAVMAGLKLFFGADKWSVSCATWRRNFPDARMFEQDVTEFVHHGTDYRSQPIDVLHLSPPCQFFSPLAYPHAGRNNEENMVILFICSELIKKLRPRLFTLEQTPGLMHNAHIAYFYALIQGFTCHGYSVQWKRLPLVEYGLPQDRKRLVMIGACPGEQLPPWPAATHSSTPTRGQKPFVTEAQALQGLNRRGISLHDVANALPRNEQPRDGNLPFRSTITCSQSGYHFSGLRDHTLRETACLQGFPLWHQFEGNKTEIRKQIGNAFPSSVVKVIYEHLRQWLEHKDGIHSVPAVPALRVETQHHINGDLDEDEALRLALQESKRPRSSAQADIIELSDDDEERDSPIAEIVAPLLERMSIAASDAPPDDGAVAVAAPRRRSRSATLGFSPSPSPSPGPGHRSVAWKKRGLDSMLEGEADEAVDEESPSKRERITQGGGDEGELVGRIPSRLPRYAVPQVVASDDEAWMF